MAEAVRKAYAKINLALNVVGRRTDGYHLVDMIMQQISLGDVVTARRRPVGGISLSCDMPGVPTDQTNLAWKAAALLQAHFGIKDGIEIRLEKSIPMAAGLAGGSANAAAALLAVGDLFELELPREVLAGWALQLGADVPYCLLGGTARARGIGEELEALAPAPVNALVLAKPAVSVSTPRVYRAYDMLNPPPKGPDVEACTRAIQQGSLEALLAHMGNALEPVTASWHPQIASLEEALMEQGALAAQMSGSGPTVFGIFALEDQAGEAAGILRERLPEVEWFAVRGM